jgi:hypothetical protein
MYTKKWRLDLWKLRARLATAKYSNHLPYKEPASVQYFSDAFPPPVPPSLARTVARRSDVHAS